MEESGITISLPAQPVYDFGFFTLNNAMAGSLFISLLLVIFALYIRRGISIKPNKVQLAFEMLLEFIMVKMEMAFGSRKAAKKFVPLIFTIFFFLLIANQFSLIPIIEAVKTDGGTVFRTPATDYSLPIAFTLLVVGLAHVLALSIAPIKHIGNFIKIKPIFQIKSIKELPMALLDFFLGLQILSVRSQK